ncbi:trichohyalin [Labrus mixtus]|uniref:trichohyalin n=1 Tax=Labrus mixtus TaxID=508554 RepID=UPI0029C02E88|nr:trichohyalin [Labrus mixtus]
MDTTDENCSAVIGEDRDFPVRCTEEILLPVFTDESVQVAMDSQHAPTTQAVPSPALPELKLVLLGRKGTGKSSAGNTILGGVGGFESGKPTEECVKRKADVVGRKVTVVDTPGWEWYYPLNSTPNWVRRETLRSVSLCPPGPHAVLLVVRACASVTEDYIREIEEHLEPLGKRVWDHTMLLFTRGDELGLMSMEQRIPMSGQALQGLLQQCGNRYHVLDNRCKGDGTQVTELIRKLEVMVEKKAGSSHLEMDNTVLLGLEADGKRRARERRKKQRQMEEQVQRGTIKAALMSDGLQGSELDAHQSFSKAPRRLPEVRLVLLGERETGKSSAGNAILGKVDIFQAGEVSEECNRQQAEVAMRLVTVVDTPGWEGGIAGATPERVKREIINSVALCPPGPHALLLTLRVDTLVRSGHVKEHLELLGEGVWRHIIMLFTHGDQLREGVDIEQHIQGGGRELQWLLEKCRGRYHVISSLDGGGKGGSGMVADLLQKVEKMAAMNRCEAFSGLVQEVRDLSRQRNEKFNQRLKEMGDKMQRQDAELKNVRDREMKSIRWFFDRKKKGKSPGKADIQKEEEEEDEDRRVGERRNDIGDLEERMRWLTEDKEREIQDLSVENERIRVALNQIRKESDTGMLNLELREREIEELQERLEEQQIKLLNLERAGVENEHERKQREDVIKAEKQEWKRQVKKLEESVEQQKEERAEWMGEVESLKTEMEAIKIQYYNTLERKAQEKLKDLAELEDKLKSEMNIRLLEKDKEREKLRKQASEEKQKSLDGKAEYEKHMQRKAEEMKSQHEKEMDGNMREKEKEIEVVKLQLQEEMARRISEMESKMEKVKDEHKGDIDKKVKDNAENVGRAQKQHEKEMRDMRQEKQREIAEINESFGKEREEQKKAKGREIVELEQKYLVQLEEKGKVHEKEKERIHLDHKKDLEQKVQEKDNEVDVLKLQHQEEMERQMNEMERQMEGIKAKHREEIDQILREKSEVVESVKKEYSDQIGEIELLRQREIKELKEEFAEEIQKQKQEKQREMMDLELKHAAQIQEKVLENEKEKDVMNENLEKHILETMRERDRQTEELKHKHDEEIKEMKQDSEKEKERLERSLRKEMEQRLEVKEGDIEEMKSNLEEVEKKLQQKEEKETHLLNNKKEMEQRLQGREEEIKMIKEQLKELEQQLCQTNEERERDDLNHKNQMAQKLEEKERIVEKLKQDITNIDEILQRKEEERGEIILNQKREAEQRLQDREREMEEMKQQLLNDTDRKVKEKETEIQRLEQQADSRETAWREEQKKKDESDEKEMNRLLEIIDVKTNEIAQARRLLGERDAEFDKTCGNYLKEIQELKESKENLTAGMIEMQQRQTEEESKKNTETTERLKEKDDQLDRLAQKDQENEKEIVQLRLTIEQTKSELKQLTGKMEKEMTSMIQNYEKEIARREEESRQRVSDVAEELEESRRKVDELQEQNERMRIETDNLKLKCEEQKKENEKVKKHLKEHEEQEDNRKDEMESILAERNLEARVLKEANDKLQAQVDEAEGKLKEMIEKQSESRLKDNEIGEELLLKGKDVEEREQALIGNKEELRKRGIEIDAKEEELVERKGKLENKEEELCKWEAHLQRQQKDHEEKEKLESKRAQNIQKKERELDSLLSALEGKQMELSSHGQDIQKKVKGLKDQGKELKDREYYLRNEEQELLNWKSKLHVQNEHVNSTTQQLDEMGKDLSTLKDELQKKEKNVKAMFEKLRKWEENLKEREDGINERHLENRVAKVDRSEYNLLSVDKQVSEKGGKGRGRESDRGQDSRDWEDDKIETAASSAKSNNCHIETLKEKAEEKEEIRGGEVGQRKKQGKDNLERTLIIEDLQFVSASQGQSSSNNKDFTGSDLKVMVLGESWSSRSPSGVSILFGEAPKLDGSSFRTWQGQKAGRRLALVEPLGLKWRDGPDSTHSVQRKNICDGISWCHPGPHVVLLLMPAFLTCTPKYRRAVEEHMSVLRDGVWRHTLVLFTCGEFLGESAEQHILRNGELSKLVEQCGGRYHVISSKMNNSAIEGLLEKMEGMLDSNSWEQL